MDNGKMETMDWRKQIMKKTFTRALSGLLAAALIVAMPVAAAAEDGIATYSVSEVNSVCNHTAAATNDTVKAVKTVAPTWPHSLQLYSV